jgi:hypothetical protein
LITTDLLWFLQDDLDDYVDVTNSRLQVYFWYFFIQSSGKFHCYIVISSLCELNFDINLSLIQRVQKRLAILNKRVKGGCSCMALLISVVAIVFLAVIAWLLIKHL